MTESAEGLVRIADVVRDEAWGMVPATEDIRGVPGRSADRPNAAGRVRGVARDHAFVRTRPVVKLFEIGTVFVSRSEARRFLDGLDADFDTVEVGFTGVTDAGQGFVDELLRVWPAAHPGKTVIPINMNKAVEFMIQRGLPRIERQDQPRQD